MPQSCAILIGREESSLTRDKQCPGRRGSLAVYDGSLPVPWEELADPLILDCGDQQEERNGKLLLPPLIL
jgi:hypothetical protein